MNGQFSDLTKIWDARYFWMHLALSDLNSKWRRSFFGVFWSVLQPLGMAFLLSLVLSRLLHIDISRYAPYVFSGVITWEFVVSSVTLGSVSFIQAAPYIKQCKQPLPIYTLRTVVSALIVFFLASLPLYFWVLIVMPQNFNISWIAILAIYPILVSIAWPLATLLAYIGARFRDLTPAISLLMQALWFVSPVNFEENMFRSGGLGWLVDFNPIYHVLQLVRAPLLSGQFPTFRNYLSCMVVSMFFIAVALIVRIKSERKVIFYL